MKTILTKGLDKDQVTEIKGAFTESSLFRKRVIEILEDKIDATRTNTTLKEEYNNPNWAYKQADAIGYERALRELINIFSEK